MPYSLLFGLLLCSGALFAQTPAVYTTQRIEGAPPAVDGTPDEAVWDQVPWSDGYYQWEPSDADTASVRTCFKILYDQRFLYVAYRCYDPQPGGVEARLSRRDNFPGDWIEMNFDSFNDKQTGFSFTTSASGVKNDEFISNDGNNWDSSWNPTWLTKAKVDSLGYTVESRIPFSQLRFGEAEEQVWGLQSTRRVFRLDERDVWSPVKQAQNGWVSRFGELRGIRDIKPRKPLELQPYVLGQLNAGGDFLESDPFNRRVESRASIGLDGRIGITNDLAVDFTINPDFGQVEADPGAINLDGFQIFFREQRPFFVENQNIYTYRLTQAEAGGPYNADLLFYSRRIGGAPSRFVRGDAGVNFFVDQPENTTILGAAKLSGKTKNGLSVGLLSAVTEREFATLDRAGERSREEVEPLTAYNVVRFQQDYNDRNTTVGGIVTSVNRNIATDGAFSVLRKSANSGGVDVLHRWKDRAWYLRANLTGSRVAGSRAAITRTQTAFEHLFQRPGDRLTVDTNRTSLSGHGGAFHLGESAGDWIFEAGGTWRSPGLELNDIGFLQDAGTYNVFAWAARRWQKPMGIFRRLQWNNNLYSGWDWSGQRLGTSFNFNGFAQFKNFWGAGGGLNVEVEDYSKNALRGGPIIRRPAGLGGFFNFRTDDRKDLWINFFFNGGRSYDFVARGYGYGFFALWQASDALSFSFNPSYNRSARDEQYVTQLDTDAGPVYLNGEIVQRTLDLTLRATFNLTPDFTIQYYGQPFVAEGAYTNFNRVSDRPLAKAFDERFVRFGAEAVAFDAAADRYTITDAEKGSFSFSDPDFSFVQFRSNLVVRWEYRPNSELYFVWSQGVNQFDDRANGVWNALDNNLFGEQIRNTFLVKATYRWVR